MEANIPSTPNQKMAAYRERMRAQGLRSVQVWVPDTRSSEFHHEVQRQAQIIAKNAEYEDEIMQQVEEAADDIEGWTA